MSIMHPTIENGFNVPPFLVRIVKCLEINHTKGVQHHLYVKAVHRCP